MPPKRKSATNMDALLDAAIEKYTTPQRYKTSVAMFIRSGSHVIKLMGADSKPTPAGILYYKKLGVSPLRFVYDQGLINDQWVRAFDGSTVRVRTRNADGTWSVTKAGEAYFRYNRTQFLPNVPHLIVRENGKIITPSLSNCYMPLRNSDCRPYQSSQGQGPPSARYRCRAADRSP
jgi:hypothetical protein